MQSLVIPNLPSYDARLAKDQQVSRLMREIINLLPPNVVICGVAVTIEVGGKQIMITKKAK